MKKVFVFIALALVTIVGFLTIFGEPLLLHQRASNVEKHDIGDIKNLLQPSMIISKPEGEGPFPVILQFHGCAGARLPFQKMYAEIANQQGYMSVIVDSMRPRGYSREKAVSTVCSGKEFMGQERAGDVVAALDYVLNRVDTDENNIILAGWSHGAWTIMDLMTMDLKKRLPVSLKSYQGALPKIKGAVLFYPYCGIGTLSRKTGWTQNPKILALIAGDDHVVNHKQCLKMFNKLEKKNISINKTVYENTEHAFDDPFIEDEWKHWHNPENMRDALSRYGQFLKDLH